MRQTVLLVAGIAAIILFFQLPLYKKWLSNRIVNYKGGKMSEQIYELDVEDRMKTRFKDLYLFTNQVKEKLAEVYPKDKAEPPLILMLPPAYVKTIAPSFIMPEPLTFYYLTGLRCTYTDRSDVYNVNCALLARSEIVMLKSKADIDTLLDYYKTLTPKEQKQ